MPLCQGVASCHPKGRSEAKEPRSGLTRRNVLTPGPTSCGLRGPLFATCARLYAAINRRIAGLVRIGVDVGDRGHGSVGFSLDSDFQGRGFATAAVVQVVRLGFEELGLHRIWATVDTRAAVALSG